MKDLVTKLWGVDGSAKTIEDIGLTAQEQKTLNIELIYEELKSEVISQAQLSAIRDKFISLNLESLIADCGDEEAIAALYELISNY
jgi:signal-transduction protein with cAMP-binding, CBS, and nucleotidyltransferase domain